MPAILENDRFRFELYVAGYEFESDFRDAYDANWLVFRVVLQSMFGAWRWQVEDAGALTWEVAGCVNWLRDLAAGQLEQDSYHFSEPDVSFDIILSDAGDELVGLSVNLMDEFQPPTKVLVPRENNIVTLRFHTPADVLNQLADQLEVQLNRFPQRGELPENTR
jgi:hypothetical protein